MRVANNKDTLATHKRYGDFLVLLAQIHIVLQQKYRAKEDRHGDAASWERLPAAIEASSPRAAMRRLPT